MNNNLYDNLSKYGKFMYNLTYNFGTWLIKHRWLYYLLACTWGIIMTLIGVIITIVTWPISWFTKKVRFEKYHWIYKLHIGPQGWGGCEMGLMFFRDQENNESLNKHEFGHTFQNCLLGPLFPILVGIPSAIRYWYREIVYLIDKKKYFKLPAYDAIWFELSATNTGITNTKYLEEKEAEKALKKAIKAGK